MAEIHRRTGIHIETLGDLKKLVSAAESDGYTDTDLTNRDIYLYFEKGTSVTEETSPYTGRCGQCMRPNVPANADGVALKHNIGDTEHSGACRGSGSKVTGLRRHR